MDDENLSDDDDVTPTGDAADLLSSPERYYRALGERLLRRIEDRELNFTQLAARYQRRWGEALSASQISKLLHAQHPLKVHHLHRLCLLLEMDLAEAFGEGRPARPAGGDPFLEMMIRRLGPDEAIRRLLQAPK